MTDNEKCYIQTELVRAKSRITRLVNVPPTKFIAPESHASGALCFMSNYGGGMLGGDSVRLDIKVGEESGLVLLPQANSRAYTDSDNKIATQYMNVAIEKGARFVFNADPLVLHEKSRYHQETRVRLGEDAGGVIVDWFSIGRSENNEKFLFTEYSSDMVVEGNGGVILIDRQKFSPYEKSYNTVGSFGSFSQMLNIFFVGSMKGIGRDLDAFHKSEAKSDYIYSITSHNEYTIVRTLAKSRQALHDLLEELFVIISRDVKIGFDAVSRKM